MPKSTGGMIDGSPIIPRMSLLPEISNVHMLGVVSSEVDVMPSNFFKKRGTHKRNVFARSDGCSETVETVASGRPYVFQQNDVPVHTSHLIQNWLSIYFDNIDIFWSKEFLDLPTDLNPLDY